MVEKGALDESDDYVATHQFVWGLYLDELLVYDFDDDGDGDFDEIDQENGDKRYYACQDFTYSAHALINSSGTVQERYDYQPYGAPSAWSPDYTDPRPLTPDTCVFLFTGQLYDAETGLYHYKARPYSPSVGRLITRDRQGYEDGANLYLYVRSRPQRKVDPRGLSAETTFAITIEAQVTWKRTFALNWLERLTTGWEDSHRSELWAAKHRFYMICKSDCNVRVGGPLSTETSMSGTQQYGRVSWLPSDIQEDVLVWGGYEWGETRPYSEADKHYSRPVREMILTQVTHPPVASCGASKYSSGRDGLHVFVFGLFEERATTGEWSYSGSGFVQRGPFGLGGGVSYTPPNLTFPAKGGYATYEWVLEFWCTQYLDESKSEGQLTLGWDYKTVVGQNAKAVYPFQSIELREPIERVAG